MRVVGEAGEGRRGRGGGTERDQAPTGRAGPPTARPARDARLARLTGREHEVLLQVAHGPSNAGIAAALTVSEVAVKPHIGRVLGKLDLRDRVQAVVFAYQNGLVRPTQRAWSARPTPVEVLRGPFVAGRRSRSAGYKNETIS
jgi:DNA-binding CsgD family transcriptional regulator